MKTEYTKGEWRFSKDWNEITISPKGIIVGSQTICKLESFGKTEEELKANGNLIAAAPELLAALNELLDLLSEKEPEMTKEWYLKKYFNNAMSAINKATE
jgi:hypothetical protein